MRPTREEIETFVRESGAIAEEDFNPEDEVVKRHLDAAKIVSLSYQFGQAELYNGALCGIQGGWLRNSVSTANMDRVPEVRHISQLLKEWHEFVYDGLSQHRDATDDMKEAFAWRAHDELICLRPFKHKNGETARLMLNSCRQLLGLPWKLVLYDKAALYFDHVDTYRARVYMPRYRSRCERREFDIVVT